MIRSKLMRNSAVLGTLALAILLSGCKGVAIKSEKEARRQVQTVAADYRPEGKRTVLPELTPNSSLSNYLTYALLNQPKVEAAYFDWLASVERITVQRSLPDPQLTFQMDIQDVVTSLMPGLMMSFPGMGKLRAAGAVAAAESEGKYFAFKTATLESAYEVKRAYYQLYFLDEKIRVNRETLDLLSELEKMARAQNEVGKVTLQDVLRAQNEQGRLRTDLANLQDSRGQLLARFKAALGMKAEDPAPPLPQRFESTALDLTSDKLLEQALAQNTRLQAMAADVRAADAAITQAYRARMPDTSVGFMADVKMNPVLYRPWGTVSLPLWRDKLAALVAEAQANKRAGQARLSAGELELVVDFAERAVAYREASRNLELLQNELLPRQRQSLEVARSGYVAGQIDFFNLTDAEQTFLRFALNEIEARTQRELSLTELSLLVQGLSPSGAPAGSPMGSAKMGGAAASGSMGLGGPGMLPGNSAPPKKSTSGQM